jgi:hypothetical protein
MRRLRAVTRHALPFWRYWNRPLEPGWAMGLGAQVFVLTWCWLFAGGWLAVGSALLFAAGLYRYTTESFREYRSTIRQDDGPPSGDRFEVHDRHDIFRRFPWQ